MLLQSASALAGEHLPLSKTFIGQNKFHQMARKAVKEQWGRLPMGSRMVKVAKELEGLPYKSYTLEIDNHVESPSVNFSGMDCWTFFETCLAFCRMLETPKAQYTPHDLLRQIEWTRYRGGRCNGNYLDRIHYLAEWYTDNHKRGNIYDLTRRFPSQRMHNKCQEMTILWKSYRYLKHNPHLRRGMAEHEARLTKMPVYMVPKHKVASIENQLQNGDIIGIASKHNGGYCSHVGIVIKDAQGRARFMHASTTYKKVVIDSTISGYLYKFNKHAGILVARPR
ncbi:N-acetylmuramoyl-L-alanine amidase-like domain-containing protein [Oceaniferula spumae]